MQDDVMNSNICMTEDKFMWYAMTEIEICSEQNKHAILDYGLKEWLRCDMQGLNIINAGTNLIRL